MNRSSVFGAAALIAVAPLAQAQESWRSEEDRLVSGLVQEDLAALVGLLGHTVDAEGVLSGIEGGPDVSVRASTPEGLIYELHGRACSEEAFCRGLNVQVRYTFEDAPNFDYLNQANYSRAAINVWYMPGFLGVNRYLILDNGLTLANLKTNVEATLAMAPYMVAVAQNGLQG